jgi:putative FmdB family regulatory protein
MPIYEYTCSQCGKDFEKLVYGSQSVECPACSSEKVVKKLSLFGMAGVEKPFAGQSSCGSCEKSSCTSCS